MRIQEFKDWINSLPESEMDKELGYYSDFASGFVNEVAIAEQDLYYLDTEDPSLLYTYDQLIEDGYEEEEIESLDIEIFKGDYLIIL